MIFIIIICNRLKTFPILLHTSRFRAFLFQCTQHRFPIQNIIFNRNKTIKINQNNNNENQTNKQTYRSVHIEYSRSETCPRVRLFTRRKWKKIIKTALKKSKGSRTRSQGSWGMLSVDVRSFELGTCNFWIRGHTSELSYAEDAANFNALTTNYYTILLLFYIIWTCRILFGWYRVMFTRILCYARGIFTVSLGRYCPFVLFRVVVLCGVKMLILGQHVLYYVCRRRLCKFWFFNKYFNYIK